MHDGVQGEPCAMMLSLQMDGSMIVPDSSRAVSIVQQIMHLYPVPTSRTRKVALGYTVADMKDCTACVAAFLSGMRLHCPSVETSLISLYLYNSGETPSATHA